jgi:hypothetical protein
MQLKHVILNIINKIKKEYLMNLSLLLALLLLALLLLEHIQSNHLLFFLTYFYKKI